MAPRLCWLHTKNANDFLLFAPPWPGGQSCDRNHKTCQRKIGSGSRGRRPGFELTGPRKDYFADRGDLRDVDLGHCNVTEREQDTHQFKVPAPRNVAQTYPCFHDASAATLKDAVRTRAACNGYRAYSDAEADKVVAFLQTLTGEYRGRPLP